MLLLAFDVVNRKLVSYRGSPATLPPFSQSPYIAKLYFVQESTALGAIPGSYEIWEQSPTVLPRMGIWSDSTGTLDDSDDLKLAFASEYDWTWNADEQCFDGIFNCRTTELAEEIGEANQGTFYFAVSYLKDGAVVAVYDHKGFPNCTVYSSTDDGGNAPVSIADSVAIFRSGKIGIRSAGGTVVVITVADDGAVNFPILNPP
jgi:hypothetical protein